MCARTYAFLSCACRSVAHTCVRLHLAHLAAAQESRLPGYEQLYNDSMRRRLKLEALAQLPPEEATFKPRASLGVATCSEKGPVGCC